jgi:hypothetical protein
MTLSLSSYPASAYNPSLSVAWLAYPSTPSECRLADAFSPTHTLLQGPIPIENLRKELIFLVLNCSITDMDLELLSTSAWERQPTMWVVLGTAMFLGTNSCYQSVWDERKNTWLCLLWNEGSGDVAETDTGKKPISLKVHTEEVKEQYFCSLCDFFVDVFCLLKKQETVELLKAHEILWVLLSKLFSHLSLFISFLYPQVFIVSASIPIAYSSVSDCSLVSF